jgi:hypothetical protein
MQYTVEIDQYYTDLLRDHPQVVKAAIDTAVLRVLMDLNNKVLARESGRVSSTKFQP